ncbi:hypothetical protein [Stieleria bergensis]
MATHPRLMSRQIDNAAQRAAEPWAAQLTLAEGHDRGSLRAALINV